MRRIIASAFLLCILFGCTATGKLGGEGVETPAGPPVSGDWILVRLESEPDTLNPVLYKAAPSQYTMYGANNSQIYEFLLQYNTKTWALTEPLLAETYPEISADHLTYTYKLRDEVQWHDGQALTPEDVLFTFKATMSPLVDSAEKRISLTDLANVELLGDRRIRFTFSQPSVFNIDSTGNQQGIIPKHVFDPNGLLDSLSFRDIIGPNGKTDPRVKEFSDGFNKHPNNRMPIGTGPYKFEQWESGREIRLVRNDGYLGKKPYLDKIIFRVVLDSTAALTMLKAGELDLNAFLLPIQYAEQTSGPAFDKEFRKAKISIPQYQYIGWNEERSFFKDKRVRRALTMLVNRALIVEKLRFGLGHVAATPFNPSSPYFNPRIQALPYDPKKAVALLDEAGWTDHDGDGIRDKDNTAFKINFAGAASSAFTAQLLAILKDEFKKVGIKVDEKLMDSAILRDCLLDHRCDAAASAWVAPLDTDPYQIFHSSSIPNRGSNWVSFRNAESDRLLEQARAEFDLEKRKQIYWRWQELIHEEQPYTFLMYPEVPVAYQKRFQNVEFLPNRPGYNLSDWFVSLPDQKYAKP